jgi:phage shock protein PspC (stress-responsive transcriptional regulator)
VSLADELQKLETLRANGSLTEHEYSLAKARVLGTTSPTAAPGTLSAPSPAAPPVMEDNFFRQLTRSRRDRWLGGVCGGLGEYTPMPSWTWRVGFVMATLTFGVGLLPYVLMWIFVPSEGEPD